MMCIAAYYHLDNQLQITNFDQAGSKLPLITKSGRIAFIRWGRRANEPGALPFGGWVSQEDIKQGIWSKLSPMIVKLPNIKLINISYSQRYISANLRHEQPITGFYIKHGKEKRIYLVTLNCHEAISSQWPKLVKNSVFTSQH